MNLQQLKKQYEKPKHYKVGYCDFCHKKMRNLEDIFNGYLGSAHTKCYENSKGN